MDSDPITDLEEVMEDVQECCTDSEADVLLGPRSASGLSDEIRAVSLEVGLDSGGVLYIYSLGPPPPPQNFLSERKGAFFDNVCVKFIKCKAKLIFKIKYI